MRFERKAVLPVFFSIREGEFAQMFDHAYLRTLAQVFAPPAIRAMAEMRFPSGMSNLVTDSGLRQTLPRTATNRTLLDTIYRLLQSHYRCEYVYKNVIARKVLMGRHRPTSATVATELRCDTSKADFVVFNGTSTVYEIKTELDNLDRLPDQLKAYRKMFDRIFVVAQVALAEELVNLVESDIGVLAMTPKGSLRQYRGSEPHAGRVDAACIFDSLRKPEYTMIVERFFGTQPQLPNTRHYSHFKTLFTALPPATAHSEMVAALRERFRVKFDWPLFKIVPDSLTAGILGTHLSTNQAESLACFLELEYNSV